MRDRLIELIDECRCIEGVGMELVEKQADHLLAAGVIVPPCKVGDMVYCIRYGKARKPYVKPLEVHAITAWRNETFSVFTTKEDIWNISAFSTKEEAERRLK